MTKKRILTATLLAIGVAVVAQAEPITVLTANNRLLTIDSAAPNNTISETLTVTGLPSGEFLQAIDYRPATGTLYALGSTGTIYPINADTGVARPGVSLIADPSDSTSPYAGLSGRFFGFDFNPAVDRLRVVTETGQNLRINVETGATITDGNLDYAGGDPNAAATPNVVGAAYTNNFATAGATTLYNIDSRLDVLTIQIPPNEGALRTVGPLGVNTFDEVGFDISGVTGVAYAALNMNELVTQLYTINLLTGAATPVNTATPISSIIAPTAIGSNSVIDIAAFVNPGSRLDNISTRGRVGSSDQDFLIAGFITRGGVSSRILVRGIGPSLAQRMVTAPLTDPELEIFDNNGMSVGSNDNWKSNQQDEIQGSGLAPESDAEAAILRSLPPGAYTTVLSGKDTGSGRATGTALVEVYQLQQ